MIDEDWLQPLKQIVGSGRRMLTSIYGGVLWLSWLLSSPILSAEQVDESIQPLVQQLMAQSAQLETVAFADLIHAATGRVVLPLERSEPVFVEITDLLGAVLDDLFEDLAEVEHSIHAIGRINEVSRPIEDALRERLDAADGWVCGHPVNARGDFQRSGYPDLRLEHLESGRVFYLDPKVYRVGSERSSFRTFYYEPKAATNKILDDATHLIIGIAHNGRVEGVWQFERWQLVDLFGFQVRLKAEFQASNRDLYREDAIILESR